MARLSNSEKEKRQQEARRLYISGINTETIARAVAVGRDTIARWVAEGKWEENRDAQALSIDEVNNLILKAILQIKEGKKPVTSPDQIAKLVAAFEKLNDKQKSLRYGMYAYNILTDRILTEVQGVKNKQQREIFFSFSRQIRSIMDGIIDSWFLDEQN